MKAILISIRATLMLAAVTCGVYPLIVTGIAKTVFKDQASGSLITNEEGVVIGSTLLGQNFTSDRYFHPRPSAAGAGYDAGSSGGSNLGPTSTKLHDAIRDRVIAYRAMNGLSADAKVPADAVTASGSGLDPHISPANAELQSARVAKARNLDIEKVKELVTAHTIAPDLGFLGESRVNVLLLNLALDEVKPAN